ncbi:MAG: UDP-N-acetylmuramate--L-alanine ligase [Deltaproteobacteria bacterium]|nr:UDP-N-acetylmuramate--L-alanine ligase [Deltaproteobacteria bacterium]
MKISFEKVKKIHLIAVGGMGMGSLAGLLKEKGFEVSGSDANIYPPMSDQLQKLGVRLDEGYRAENLLPRPDLVVVGNAVSKTNPEVVALLQNEIPYCSMPEALKEFFLKGKKSLVVAGTHGKTTTASILSWLLTEASLDPCCFVGGILKNFDRSYRFGNGPYCVTEGDEYDTAFFDKGPKFVHYNPYAVLLGPVEFDHADIYKDLPQVLDAFEKLIGVLPENGLLVASADNPNTISLAKKFKGNVITYGFSPEAQFRAESFSFGPAGGAGPTGTSFRLFKLDQFLGVIESPMMGEHNIQNLLGVIALLLQIGLSLDQMRRGLKTFQGVKRRQEVRGVVSDIVVIDDFAHHPTAIAETLKAIRARYKGYKLWALFEPRSNTSRRNTFQEEFASAFQGADQVVIADLYQPEKIPEGERLDISKLVGSLQIKGIKARFLPTVDEIVATVRQEVSSHSVLLVMSNGGFGGIHDKLLISLGEPSHGGSFHS